MKLRGFDADPDTTRHFNTDPAFNLQLTQKTKYLEPYGRKSCMGNTEGEQYDTNFQNDNCYAIYLSS